MQCWTAAVRCADARVWSSPGQGYQRRDGWPARHGGAELAEAFFATSRRRRSMGGGMSAAEPRTRHDRAPLPGTRRNGSARRVGHRQEEGRSAVGALRHGRECRKTSPPVALMRRTAHPSDSRAHCVIPGPPILGDGSMAGRKHQFTAEPVAASCMHARRSASRTPRGLDRDEGGAAAAAYARRPGFFGFAAKRIALPSTICPEGPQGKKMRNRPLIAGRVQTERHTGRPASTISSRDDRGLRRPRLEDPKPRPIRRQVGRTLEIGGADAGRRQTGLVRAADNISRDRARPPAREDMQSRV